MDDAPTDREAELAAHYQHCGQLLREHDRDLWLACLFAPQETRPHLHAIYAFAAEIAGVREKTSQPLLGEMRLRWWYDALEAPAEERGGARAHPVADALFDTIEKRSVPRDEIIEMIEARAFDLYDEPMETLEALETYCVRTVGAPMRWSAHALDADGAGKQSEALKRAGLALGLTGLLRALPRQLAHGQRFLPSELAARHGVSERDLVEGVASTAVRAMLSDLRSRAREHYEAARSSIQGATRSQAALLPAAVVPLYLDRMERKDYDPFRTDVEPPQWRRQWRLWRAARAGGL